MHRNIVFAAGVGRACIAAGPVFLAATVLFSILASPAAVAVDTSSLVFLPALVPAVLVGGLLAIIPNLIGTALLANIGRANVGMRLPALWGLVGGLMAGGAATYGGAEGATIAAFAATGTVCALVCRSGTRWPEG